MPPRRPRLAPALLLLVLLGVPPEAAAFPDSASGVGDEPDPWPQAVPQQPMPQPAASAPTPVPDPSGPERPVEVPREVSVGDLALQEPARQPGPAQPKPPGPLHYPLAVAATEQAPWGWRYSTARGAWRMHTGLDLIAPEGTAVLAVQAGQVQRVAVIDGYGLTMLLDHGGGWSSLYAHLLRVSVEPGERVGAGQPLGLVGQSGNASTAHLHLELRQRQARGPVAVDPTPLLPGPQASDAGNRVTSRADSSAAVMP